MNAKLGLTVQDPIRYQFRSLLVAESIRSVIGAEQIVDIQLVSVTVVTRFVLFFYLPLPPFILRLGNHKIQWFGRHGFQRAVLLTQVCWISVAGGGIKEIPMEQTGKGKTYKCTRTNSSKQRNKIIPEVQSAIRDRLIGGGGKLH